MVFVTFGEGGSIAAQLEPRVSYRYYRPKSGPTPVCRRSSHLTLPRLLPLTFFRVFCRQDTDIQYIICVESSGNINDS